MGYEGWRIETGKTNKKSSISPALRARRLSWRLYFALTCLRRYTRLTNGFSRKVENHACAVALHYMYYNFGRIHKALRVTPAMEAKVTDHVWTLEKIARLAD